MKAIGYAEFGGPAVLTEFQLPDPVAGSGEVPYFASMPPSMMNSEPVENADSSDARYNTR